MVTEQVKILRALSDETRIRIVQCLLDKERCACTIYPLVNKAQSTVSQHLRILQEAGILESRREGINIWYVIKSQKAIQILQLLEIPEINTKQTC